MRKTLCMLLVLSILLALTACGKAPEAEPSPEPERLPAAEEKKETPVAAFNPNASPEPEWVRNEPEKPAEPPEEAPEEMPEPEPEPEDAPADGIRPEFKELLDSYEAFFDSYVEFMQKYKESGNSTAMLGDYMDFMNQYLDMTEKLEALGEEEMSDEEAVYYAEVSLRISQKLLKTAQ